VTHGGASPFLPSSFARIASAYLSSTAIVTLSEETAPPHADLQRKHASLDLRNHHIDLIESEGGSSRKPHFGRNASDQDTVFRLRILGILTKDSLVTIRMCFRKRSPAPVRPPYCVD
jgi:hypothetical protein